MILSPPVIGIMMIILFFILLYLKMPVGISLLIPGFIGFCLIRGVPVALSSIGIICWQQGLKEALLLIPIFTLMGMLAAEGGISKDAFSSLYKWVGHLPGGLSMACTAACAAFGAVSGNNLATSLTMTSVALPEMRKYKYREDFSIATIAAGGNLGIMIPPSGSFVFFGLLTETSIGALFIAGVLPGILIMLLICLQIYIQCRVNPKLGPPGAKATIGDKLQGSKGLLSIVFVFAVVMGGIFTGLFTPNEGASCGVFIVFLIGLLNKKLKFKSLLSALKQTIMISSMIMLMILGAMYFGSFVAISQIPAALGSFIATLGVNRYLIIGIILLVYFIAGCVMDMYPVLAITLPIFFPIILELGFDPLQFGVLSVLITMIGSISPPFGMQIFALAGMNKEVPIGSIFRSCIPFIITMLICLVIIVFFPKITTLLPDMMIPYR